ncbi:phosphatidylglycerophosphatase A, partial [Candidatus Photodesmus katoptron]
YIFIIIILFILGIKACQVVSDDIGGQDHASIVWDEFIGFWVTMSVLPFLNISIIDWKWLLAGFIVFRVLDILKPWPISWLDKNINGGLGIMIDDIVAGMIASVILYFVGKHSGWILVHI